jgi:ABC-type Na+ efflux pump permease subunit
MRQVMFILRKDLKYMLRERETILWVFLLPLLFFWFIGTVTGGFSGGGGGPTRVGYFTPPGAGHLADRLEERLTAADFETVRRDTLVSPAVEGRWFAFTPGFTDSVLTVGSQGVVRFHPSEEGLSRQYEEFRAQRVTYTLLADLVAADQAGLTATPAVLDSLEALPRTVQVEVAPAGRRMEIPTGMQQSVPGIMVMFTLLIMTTSGAILLVIERRRGLLRRLAATPIPRTGVVLGKWGAKFCLGLIQIAYAMVVAMLPPFNIDWGANVLAVIAVMFWYGAFMAAVGMLLGSLSRTEGMASAIGVISANAMGALGGCWWPIEVTPPVMQKLSLFLPTGWAMDAIHKLVSFGEGPLSVTPHILGMALGTAILLAINVRVFRYE